MSNNLVSQFKIYKSNNKTIQRTTASLKNNCNCIKQFTQDVTDFQTLFNCQNCNTNMEKVTNLKKQNIILQYENAKLQEKLQKMFHQNNNLKKKLKEIIEGKLADMELPYSPTFKQDLQAELFECKLLNQLIIIGQYNKNGVNPLSEDKLQQSLLQRLMMQQQLQQKNRIINDTVLYPIYHYDARIKSLRDAVVYFYKMAHSQNKKLRMMIKEMGKQILNFKNKFFCEIQVIKDMKIFNEYKQNLNDIINVNNSKIFKAKQNQKELLQQRQQIQKQNSTEKGNKNIFKQPEKKKNILVTDKCGEKQKISKSKIGKTVRTCCNQKS